MHLNPREESPLSGTYVLDTLDWQQCQIPRQFLTSAPILWFFATRSTDWFGNRLLILFAHFDSDAAPGLLYFHVAGSISHLHVLHAVLVGICDFCNFQFHSVNHTGIAPSWRCGGNSLTRMSETRRSSEACEGWLSTSFPSCLDWMKYCISLYSWEFGFSNTIRPVFATSPIVSMPERLAVSSEPRGIPYH